MSKVWLFPAGVERDYSTDLKRAVKNFNKEIDASIELLLNSRQDSFSDDITSIFNALRNRAKDSFRGVIERLPGYFSITSMFNDKQWRLVVKAYTGFDIPRSTGRLIDAPFRIEPAGIMPVLGVDAYRSEPWLAELQAMWVAENVRLIESIPYDQLDDMEGIIRRGVMAGLSMQEISRQIQERYHIPINRADLIASDQIGKANADLTIHRMGEAGVDHYIWRGVMDSRERQLHVDREKKRFSLKNPPSGGHPGQAIRCRCWSEPDFTGSIFDITQ